ncbi:MAG: hypothetical protein HYX75_02690 [Acidobacteria bacterium]|nr:hypothetical protein [Acidobacteriota bacterium]
MTRSKISILGLLLLLAGLLQSPHLARSAGARSPAWIHVGPYGADVTCFAGDAQGTVFYAGTSEGRVFSSSPFRGRWRPRGLALAEPSAIVSLVVDPADSDVLYAATEYSGIFKTVDGGASWRRLGGGLPAALHIDNWGLASSPLLVSSSSPPAVYVNLRFDGVFKSVDGGESWWQLRGGGAESVHCLAISRWAPETLYAATARGLFRTTDSGALWRKCLSGEIRAVTLDPSRPSRLYASSQYKGFFRSDDEGATWTRVADNPQSAPLVSIVVEPNAPGAIYAAAMGGYAAPLWKSLDMGLTWEEIRVVERSRYSDPDTFALIASQPTVLLAAVAGHTFESTDGGRAWRLWDGGLTTTVAVNSLVLDAARPQRLYAGTSRGLFIVRDRGRSWKALAPLRGHRIFAVGPRDPRTLYAGEEWGEYLIRSDDGGRSWTRLDSDPFPRWRGVWSLVADPQSPGTIYASGLFDIAGHREMEGDAEGLLKSVDRGETWTVLHPFGTRALAMSQLGPYVIYAAGVGAVPVSKSTDGGRTWIDASAGLRGADVISIAVDPESPETVYISTADRGVLRSVDGGELWVPARAGLPDATARSFATSTGPIPAVYVGLEGAGVYRSTDRGVTWEAADSGIEGLTVDAIAVDPGKPGLLYAGTSDSGLFVSPTGGQ